MIESPEREHEDTHALTVAVITLRAVNLRYVSSVETVTALDDVSLEVRPGELVAVFGSSGSGKTTLLNVAGGLQVADSGTVIVTDRALNGLGESDRALLRLADVGVIFQDNNLIPEFTALENVMLPLRARNHSAADATAEAHEYLELVGLNELGRRMPSELSGGQKQRVGIARALVGGRRVLLADEPTGSLDTENSRAVLELLRIFADRGVAIMVATHDPLVRQFADRIVTMSDGGIVSIEAAE